MNNNPKLNQKTMTKLLNPEFRRRVLQKANKNAILWQEIKDYAKYVCDSQILQRMEGYETDNKSGWGFPQLNVLCCFKDNGEFEKKFFEFNTVNHFLKDKDGDSAAEVVACILWLWKSLDSAVASFDYEKIDAELAKIDAEIKVQQEKDRKINDMGKRIYDLVKPIVDKVQGAKYEDAAEATQHKVEKILEEFVKSGDIFKYIVSLSRNTKETIQLGHFFLDIGYKLEDKADFTVLACHVSPQSAENEKTQEKSENRKQSDANAETA